MITNYNKFILNEKNINIELLSRSYENWWNVFLKKLNNNESFELVNGDIVYIKNYSEIISKILNDKLNGVDIQRAYDFFTKKDGKKGNRYNKQAIELTNGRFIGLNDIKRTTEFGSSPGSSTGLVQTRINETIQTIFFSLRYNKKNTLTEDDVNNFIEKMPDKNLDDICEDLLNVYINIDTKAIIKKSDLSPEKGWMTTHLDLANALFDILDFEEKSNLKYVFYQAFAEKELLNVIHNKFYELIHNIPDLNININFAKWNPADVFVVNSKEENKMIENIRKCTDFVTFNSQMDIYFNERWLIGISLKKITRENNLKFIINKDEESYFYYDYSNASINPLASMSVNIHVNTTSTIHTNTKQIMTARIYTDKEESDILLEIQGVKSKGGKASLNYLNKVLTDIDVTPIPTYKEIFLTNDELINEIEKYYSILDKNKLTKTRGSNHDISKTRSKLISKYQSLMIVDILETNKNKPIRNTVLDKFFYSFTKMSKSDYIVKSLFYYAYAMGNEIFQNCKYYRISNSEEYKKPII